MFNPTPQSIKERIDMSEKYSTSSEVPTEILVTRLDQLADAVTKGANGTGQFTMSVPAQVDRDADIVLVEAGIRLTALRTENEQLREALKHLYHNAYNSGADMGIALDVAREALQPKQHQHGEEKRK
jgi:hypothetical protein